MSFDAFKAESNRGDTTEPPDGQHTATLVAAKVGESRAGDKMVILEWQTTDFAYYWTSFHRTSGKASYFTGQVLDKLGVDIEKCTRETQEASWDAVDAVLGGLNGTVFTIKITRNGDFLNTGVVDRPDHVQPELPVSTEDFIPAKPASVFDDDDIPF